MIDQSKTYRTRDGREVRIYATDGSGPWPVHGAVREGGRWSAITWREDGKQNHNMTCSTDLIESDPHIGLSRHRELLVAEFEAAAQSVRTRMARLDDLDYLMCVKAALIALARLEKEKGE